MILKRIKIPEVKFIFPRDHNYETVEAVNGNNQWPWLAQLGIEEYCDRLTTLQAWMEPTSVLNIHKDLVPSGKPLAWSIVYVPRGQNGMFLSVFDAIDPTINDVMIAVSKQHNIPILKKENARLLERVELVPGEGVLFDPGSYYHSVENTSDQWRNAVSVRAELTETLDELLPLLTK